MSLGAEPSAWYEARDVGPEMKGAMTPEVGGGGGGSDARGS